MIQNKEVSEQDNLPRGIYQTPSSFRQYEEEAGNLIKVLTSHDDFLNILRQELKGVQLYEDKNGERSWVQVDKPTFIKLDKNNQPLKVWNDKLKKYDYICNDEAVSEIIDIIKLCGLNPVSPLTIIDENEIRADLLEMESKIAVLLANKRKKWGIDKALYPVYIGKIKILIKDARYKAKDGIVLKAIRTITSRIENTNEQQRQKTIGERITSPFS